MVFPSARVGPSGLTPSERDAEAKMGDEIKDMDDRNAQLEELADSVAEDREPEEDVIDEEVVEPEDDTEEEPEEDAEEESEEETEEEQEEPESDDEPLEEYVKVVVDGKTQVVSKSERDAWERTSLKATEEKETQTPEEDPLEKANVRLTAATEAYTQASLDADEKAMRETFQEVLTAQNEIHRVQSDRQQEEFSVKLARQELTRRIEAPMEEGGIGDVFSDRYAKAVCSTFVDEIVGDDKSKYNDFASYKAAAEKTREYLGWNKKDDFEDKKEKKKKVVNIKTAQSKTPSSVKNEQPKSREQWRKEGISELKRQRGQTD